MRRLIWICGILGVLAVGALVLLPSLANVEQFRGVLRAEMQKQLARDVDFTGMHLKLWPLSIALDQLQIAEAPDFPTGRPFVTAREIRVRVALMALLGKRAPRSLEICALLHKHIATELEYETKFIGFDAPHEFLVGYGLDHAENFRHLPYIASLQ